MNATSATLYGVGLNGERRLAGYLCVASLSYLDFSFVPLFSPQDLKPSNLAVNEDCELKVRNGRLETKFTVYDVADHVEFIKQLCPSDPGFWFGTAHR